MNRIDLHNLLKWLFQLQNSCFVKLTDFVAPELVYSPKRVQFGFCCNVLNVLTTDQQRGLLDFFSSCLISVACSLHGGITKDRKKNEIINDLVRAFVNNIKFSYLF